MTLILDGISRVSRILSGALIVLMAFVTGYGVVMRYVFRNPDPYAYEISCILMLVCIAFSIVYTQTLGRHLRIDLLDRYYPRSVRGILLNIIGPFAGLIFSIVLTWKSWEAAWFALQSAQVTGTVGLPEFPMRMMVPIGSALLCLVLIAQILRYFVQPKD